MAKETEKNKKVKRPSAQKRDIQDQKRRLQNRSRKAEIRTAVRGFEEAIEKGDSAVTKERLSEVYSLVDKAVKSGLYKKNKGSRTKARLTARAMAPAAK